MLLKFKWYFNIDFKKTVKYGDKLIIETEYIDLPAAKILFKFKLYRKSDNELVATAESTQVFVDKNHEMLLYTRDFILEWKQKMGLS